jgi:hypothetical protein
MGDMMNKLPVFNVIGRTLAFEVANLFTLFRLTWLPLALLVAVKFAFVHLVLSGISAPGDKPSADMLLVTIMILPLTNVVLQSLALSVVAVQVHRLVLFGERRPDHYFIFPFGWTEFRYILMGMFSMTILMVPLAIAAYWYYSTRMKAPDSVVAAILAAPEAAPAMPGGPWMSIALAIAFLLFLIWFTLRLSVWPAAVVANNRLWPGDAWRASRGNVIRLFFMFVLSLFALLLVLIGIQAAFVILAPQDFLPAATPAPAGPVLADALSGPLAQGWSPNAILLEFITQFLTATYTVAILSFAYRALKGFDAERPIGEQGEENDPILHMK